MSHPVALIAPISGAHAVKLYAGFGILGADIPNSGDNGPSPVINDGLTPDSEYHWRVVSQPASGVLTIYPNLTFEHVGASDGTYQWSYRLFENGVDQGVATVYDHFGPYNITIANSQQSNQVSSAFVRQTHLVGAASCRQSNIASAGGVSQASTTFVAGSHSTQVNTASVGSINQRHLISGTNSNQANHAVPAAVNQTHRLTAANSQQNNRASGGGATQSSSTFVAGSNSTQANQATPASVRQTHNLAAANSVQVNNASPTMIRQTHLINVANCNQRNICLAGRVSDGQTTGIRVKFNGAIVDVTAAYSKQGGVYVPVVGHAKHGGVYRQFS